MAIRTLPPRLAPIACISLTLAALTACSSPGNTDKPSTSAGAEPLAVAANFYPIEWLAERIGGDSVSVTGLTPVGEEPHDLSLTAQSRQTLEDSAVVFYLGSGFQPDVEKAVEALSGDTAAVDLLAAPGVSLLEAPADLGKESLAGNKDPHVWLDPTLMAAMAAQVAQTLSAASPENADTFAENLDVLQADLAKLDGQLRTDLASCSIDTIVTSHAAFNYLAQRYGLKQIAIAGISPEDQPDPATLEQIATDAQAAGVTTIFFEEQLSADLSETVAAEIGASVDILAALEFDPAETIGAGQDYLTVMADNSTRLAKGLQCS
jgi:zinc transport system substrate-binding protein